MADMAPAPFADKSVTSPDPFPATEPAAALHPLSLVFEFAHRIRTNLIPAIFASFSAATGGIVGLYIGLTIFGFAIVFAVIRFLTFRYRLTHDHLLINQGLVFRTHRSVPIDRIQNIDSVQNLFHRLFKVAEVRIETASGNEPEATMRVISLAEVERLRNRLSELSTNRASAASTQSDAPVVDTSAATVQELRHTVSEDIVLKIPTRRLIQAGLISNRGQVLAGLVLGYFWQASARNSQWELIGESRSPLRVWLKWAINELGLAGGSLGWVGYQLMTALVIVLAALVLLLVLRLFSAIWFVLKFYDYQLVRRGRDFQIQCGLLTKVSATIPSDRIQVVCVHRTWLARWLGLAAIRIEASGGSAKEEEDASATVARRWFVPVLAESELPQVLSALQPGLNADARTLNWQPLAHGAFQRMIRLPLLIFGLVFLVGCGIAWWLDWRSALAPFIVSGIGAILTVLMARKRAKSRKFARTETGFVYRSGTLVQKTSYGFWDRTQSVSLSQSPFDRRWGMATLLLDTAGVGTADHPLSIEYLATQTAQAEFENAQQQLAEKIC